MIPTTYTEEDTTKYYESFSDVYELVWNEQIHTGYFKDTTIPLAQAVEEMDRYIAEYAAIQKGRSLLNVGCGRGGTDRYLAKNFDLKIQGIDISQRQIDMARQRTLESSLSEQCVYTVGSATSIPFADEMFDYILCQECFFHIHDKEKAVREFKRVLKVGGLVVLEDTLLRNEHSKDEILNTFGGRVGIHDLLTPEEYIALFDKIGFKLKNKVDVSGHLITTYKKIVEFIQNNRETLEQKVPEPYKSRLKNNLRFDTSQKAVEEGKLGCMIFVFEKHRE